MKPQYTFKNRRRREGSTNYRKRVRLLTSRKNIVIFRKLSRTVLGQITKFDPRGDVTLAVASSSELEGLGWKLGKKNIPAAYLTGFLLAKKAAKKNVGKLIVGFGILGPTKGSSKHAFVKGAIDGGLEVIYSADDFPDESRIKGKHIEDYAGKSRHQFSKTPDAKSAIKIFEETKKGIESAKW